MEELNLVRVASVETESEAVFYRAALEDQGIKVMVDGLDDSLFGDVVESSGIEIKVAKSDYEKAKALIDEIKEEDGEPVPEWTCKCGEQVDEGFFVCWSCGADYPGQTAG